MPDMNGLELHRRLKDLGRSIPTIFITAFPDLSVRRRAMREGAAGYLTKPVKAKTAQKHPGGAESRKRQCNHSKALSSAAQLLGSRRAAASSAGRFDLPQGRGFVFTLYHPERPYAALNGEHGEFESAHVGRQIASDYHSTKGEDAMATAAIGEWIIFGEFRLDPGTRILTRDGRPVHLGARAYDILLALVERAGKVVNSAEFLSIVWPNMFIEGSALRVHVAALRKALGDGESGRRLIVSIRGRGYAFVGEVERTPAGRNVVVRAEQRAVPGLP
jgi:DNA-binding response OmpR family regulator